MEGLDSLKQALAGIIQKIDKLSGPGRPKAPEGVEGAEVDEEMPVEKSGLDTEMGGLEGEPEVGGLDVEIEMEPKEGEEEMSEEGSESEDPLDAIFKKAQKK
jgi:hypothetical protein